MAEPDDQYPTVIAELKGVGDRDVSLEEFEQVAALLSAEAAERMRIVEDLANSEPAWSQKVLICRFCGQLLGLHGADCLWVRARKAIR